jgi:hypothetical protein
MWDNALDLFDACLVVACLAAGPIAVAARKKGLLVQCLLLGGKELDGGRGGGAAAAGGGGGRPPCQCWGQAMPADDRLSVEDRVLGLLGAASMAVVKSMVDLLIRVCRAESAARGGGASFLSMLERRTGSEMLPLPARPPRHCQCHYPLPAVVADPPTPAPHAIIKVSNPPVNIASIDGGCAVTITVTPDINGISIPWEDGIANVHCHAIAAVACR